jgi:hypothetical protein
MQIINNIITRVRHTTAQQAVIGGVFVLALAGAAGLGMAMKQHNVSAATIRECDHNSIDYANVNGGCGATTPQEYVADLLHKDPSDLQTLAKNFSPDFNLSPAQYATFASQAKAGTAYKNGTVVVDGQTVLTNGWSIGRNSKSYASKYTVAGAGTYWKSKAQDVFAVNSIPVMVLFDNQGSVQFIAMDPCGNLMGGTKVVSTATCKALNATQPNKANPNVYSFTTSATFTGNAKISRVVYTFSDDNSVVTKTSLTDAVSHTFKKSGTVTVKVYAKVPGGHEIEAAAISCSKAINYTPPFYVCTSLIATALDDQKRNFRFTVKANSDKNTTLISADYTLDGSSTTTGVKTKDASGNIYKDYAFTDSNKHTVVAKVNFNTIEGVKSATCQASVTPTQTPVRPAPMCKPGVPVGSPSCQEVPVVPPSVAPPAELPKTGAGDVLGLFAGTSAIGAVAHRVILSRRNRQ